MPRGYYDRSKMKKKEAQPLVAAPVKLGRGARPGYKKIKRSEIVKASILLSQNGKQIGTHETGKKFYQYNDGWTDQRVMTECGIAKDMLEIFVEMRKTEFGLIATDKVRGMGNGKDHKTMEITVLNSKVDSLEAQVKSQGEQIKILEDLLIASPNTKAG